MSKWIIPFFIVVMVLGFVAYKIYPYLEGTNSQRLSTIGTLLGPIVALIGLSILIYQAYNMNKNIELQSKTFSYEQRPYLHAILNPTASGSKIELGRSIDDRTVFHGGGYLFLRNAGKIPASDIQAEYKVVSDELRKTDLMGYFEKLGGFPHIKTVFPNQNDLSVFLNPQIGREPKVVQVWAKLSYTGSNPNKRYWYLFNYLFSLKYIKDKDNNITNIQTSIIRPFEDWDRNTEAKEPQYEEPNWDQYLTVIDKRK